MTAEHEHRFSPDDRHQATERLRRVLQDKAISQGGIGITTDLETGRVLVFLSDDAAEELGSVLDAPIFLVRSDERGPSRMGG